MKSFSIILLTLSIPLILYGYWGAFTDAGNKVYDEMDAYGPFLLFVLGLFLLAVSLILRLIVYWKSKRK